MGTILSTRIANDKKVILELELDYDEYTQLRGHLHNIHIFSENNIETKANISQRGRNAATKYFLIPKGMRKNLKFSEDTACQKLDLANKKIFIYVISKGGF